MPLLAILNREAGRGDGESTSPPMDPADDPAYLSDSERRVAALAVAGYTNREIAEKLHITISTVEQHLTRAYRKLNVTGRSNLPASLHLDYPVDG
ncbi:helix-turn-helix domain-containing protein [Micromonospora sp. DT201]|uniref:helix-turn-helix domain-containing protein n=1 Tax=Micromonospora sp. DT201 TaxID=3393442 RepID=UPI003CF038EF